ncbi:hypothetical protein BAOM_2424 [Peribacillus asahii]|uniref:Uncharacterized protein n=1 Tax=Peribacillus asahii TaxID=228899 RepID=A0A3T0KRX9_9BACI|nr:hypothetical protein BAOM_2424 [Peribacillus asahii]
MSEKGCIKCGSKDAEKKEVAMTGTGLSKIFDIQHFSGGRSVRFGR